MSLRETFARARSEGRAALIGYLPAGFPDVDQSIDLMTAMVEGGCDIIEVGLPYSDPVMDGPTIQLAAQQALELEQAEPGDGRGQRAAGEGRRAPVDLAPRAGSGP